MRTIKHTRASILSRRRPSIKSIRRGPNFKHEKKTQPEADFETRFLMPLLRAGQIYGLHFHALRFNAGLGSWYEPDFTAIDSDDNQLLVYEVKGPHVYEDSIVKFKACALLYPWASWIWAERDSAGNWIFVPANPHPYASKFIDVSQPHDLHGTGRPPAAAPSSSTATNFQGKNYLDSQKVKA